MVRREKLDALFQHLRTAPDIETAKATASAIEHIWQDTSSDTARLLMQRAAQASTERRYDVALELLDKITALEPDWVEAWTLRATTRLMSDDPDGAMADIDHVMKLEPRHFRALRAMGAILRREGLDEQALQVFEKTLEIHPFQPDVQAIVDELRIEVEGRGI